MGESVPSSQWNSNEIKQIINHTGSEHKAPVLAYTMLCKQFYTTGVGGVVCLFLAIRLPPRDHGGFYSLLFSSKMGKMTSASLYHLSLLPGPVTEVFIDRAPL